MLATNEEDTMVCKSSLNDTLDPPKKQHVILHDSTDVCLIKPSDSYSKHVLFLRYCYVSCVAKGGIGWPTTMWMDYFF